MDVWISSTKTMLSSVTGRYVKANSISDVPEQQHRKLRMEPYMPLVSIGPLQMGIRRKLLYMEEMKWSCMRYLLYRTPKPDESLRKCSEAIFRLDELVRTSYADDIKLNSYDLAKIMLLDGCFLLELLISNDEDLDRKLRNISNEEEKESPGVEVGKMELVLFDLKLLENQIPIFILTVLLQTLFAQNLKVSQKIVNDGVLSLFGSSSKSIPIDCPSYAHFLDLVHWFMTREEGDISEENNHHLSITVDGNANFNGMSTKLKQTLQLKRCAVRLEAVGVTIAPLLHEDPEKRRRSMPIWLKDGKKVIFGYDKKLSKDKGMLEIQPLHITESMEVQWRSLIAWEQNRTAHDFRKEENRTPCRFSQYALLFKDLVCCEHDIQLLKDRGVLLVDDGEERSKEDLMILFRENAKGIQIDPSGDGRFRQLVNDLNAYSGARGNRRMILWHRWKSIEASARYTCRELFEIFKRDYTPNMWKTLGVIAAIILLGLTIAQTILAAISL